MSYPTVNFLPRFSLIFRALAKTRTVVTRGIIAYSSAYRLAYILVRTTVIGIAMAGALGNDYRLLLEFIHAACFTVDVIIA